MEGSAQTGRILVSTACARELSAANLGPEQGRGRLLRGRLDAAVADACVSDVTGDLAPFVPRAVTEAIRGHGRLESEHRHVTVAFLHLQGLDRRIAHGDLDAVADDLDRLVRVVQDAADRRDVCFLATDIAADGTKVILTAGVPDSWPRRRVDAARPSCRRRLGARNPRADRCEHWFRVRRRDRHQ